MYWIQYETALFTATEEYKMILKNADIFDSEFALRRADVRVEDGKIAEIGENLNGGEEHDLSGCVILPGFIDIHIHGCSRELRRNFVLPRVDDSAI